MGQPEGVPRRARRGAPGLVALLTVAVCATTAVSAAAIQGGREAEPATPGVTAPPGVTWPSGAYCGSSDPTCTISFASWRDRPVTSTTTFTGKDSWAGLEGPDSWLSDWSRSPYRSVVVVTVPMIPTTGDAGNPTPTLAEEATGAYDTHFVRLARRLISAGMGSATIRLGHELNGTWYHWSAIPDPGAYVAAWREVVTAIRAVPGANFSFDWNVAVGAGVGFDTTLAYPGDAYVDTIGEDVYDDSWGQSLSPEQRWAKLVTPGGPFSQGLQFWAAFAAAHNKLNSFAEWGLVGEGSPMANGGAGGDDPYFIEQMHSWFATHPTAFEIYFNRNPSDGSHRIDNGDFPLAAAKYLALFGGADTASPTPSASPCSGSTDVRVSTSASRANAAPLCGGTFSGVVYVFAQEPGTSSASFFVDNPARQRAPTTLDLSAPYDLMGTSSTGAARPWDLATLTPGEHTVTVLLPGTHGTQVETVSFTVAAP